MIGANRVNTPPSGARVQNIFELLCKANMYIKGAESELTLTLDSYVCNIEQFSSLIAFRYLLFSDVSPVSQ